MFNFLKKFWETSRLGIELYVRDARELFFDEVFGSASGYVRKFVRTTLAPVFIQNQGFYYNCSFNAWADALGVYFGREVSRRWLHAKAYQQGLSRKDGGAQMYVGGMVARKWGVIFEDQMPSEEGLPLDEFLKIDFTKWDKIAEQNKIGSYYTVRFLGDVWRAIDMGYPVVIGRYWPHRDPVFPWILNRDKTTDQAHGTSIIGYDSDYFSHDVDIESNSFGKDWGDKGNFYVLSSELENDMRLFGAYAISPVPYTPKDIKVKSLKDQIALITKQIFNLMQKDKLYDTAKRLLGQNLAPGNETLGCAISFSAVCNIALKDNIRFVNTSQCLEWMRSRKDLWEEIQVVEPKCVIVSPTSEIPKGSPLSHGHIGIVGQYPSDDGSFYVMSNDSNEGKWNTQFTLKKWNDYYKTYGKLPIYYFRRCG